MIRGVGSRNFTCPPISFTARGEMERGKKKRLGRKKKRGEKRTLFVYFLSSSSLLL